MLNKLLDVCVRSLNWASSNNFEGYSKFDALNSPLLWGIAQKSRFLRAAFVFGVSRMPINVRPLLFVKKKQNPKGLALFARSYFNLFEVTDDELFLDKGTTLLNSLLLISQKKNFSGHCWGYDHPWQNIAFYIPPYEPNCVVSCAVADAFLRGYELTGKQKYLDVCESVAKFILNDLIKIDVDDGMRCCSYDVRSPWKVINVNAMASSLLARLYRLTNEDEYRIASQEMMKWVISCKTDYDAWYYTDPPEASRITHDNYHTGFVIDSIGEYLKVFPEDHIKACLDKAIVFYQQNLFSADFSPKWMHDKPYPNDIHGAAQGIITFSRLSSENHENNDFAQKIINWTLENLYSSKESRFYFQKSMYWTKKYTLMRWSQAWMCYALSEFLVYSKNLNKNKK